MSRALVVRGPEDVRRAREEFRRMFRQCMQAGVAMQFKVEPHQPPKSTSQRNTVHMWFGEIASQTGSSTREVKDFLAEEFLGTVFTELTLPSGEIVTRERRRSTEDLNRVAYTEFMDRIWAWAAENDLYLTEPDADHWKRWREAAAREDARQTDQQVAA